MDNLTIGTIFFVISVIAFIVGIISLITQFKNNELREKLLKVSAITFIIAIIIFIIFINIPTDYEKEQDRKDELKRADCRSNTNAYRKCSWSVIEDRCVCKQR